jgi:hypothetical protein
MSPASGRLATSMVSSGTFWLNQWLTPQKIVVLTTEKLLLIRWRVSRWTGGNGPRSWPEPLKLLLHDPGEERS